MDVDGGAEEDLYGDLYEAVEGGGNAALKSSVKQLEGRVSVLETAQTYLEKDNQSLTTKVSAAEGEKAVLVRNISCLFKTAQMEIARKDKAIKELREELNRLKRKGPEGLDLSTSEQHSLVLPSPPASIRNDANGEEWRREEGLSGRGQGKYENNTSATQREQEREQYPHRDRSESEDGGREGGARMRVGGRGERRSGREEGGGREGERISSGERVGSGGRGRNDKGDVGYRRSGGEMLIGKFDSNRRDEDRKESGRVGWERENKRCAHDR